MASKGTLLVTGGAGYIGSHTVRHLLELGEKIVVLDSLVFGHREALPLDRVSFVEGDMADAAPPIRLEDLAQLRRPFWIVVAIGVVFTLARFSEAFLVLKANAEGLPLALAPLVLVAMNIVYALGAYPAGIFSDRVPPGLLLIWGLLALIG